MNIILTRPLIDTEDLMSKQISLRTVVSLISSFPLEKIIFDKLL